MSNRSVPDAQVIPELPYDDVGEASDWLRAAFGFKERLRIGDHRAQLVFGDGAMIAIERNEGDASTSAVPVRVEDADSHHEQAAKHGARILRPPADYPYVRRSAATKSRKASYTPSASTRRHPVTRYRTELSTRFSAS